MGPLTVEGVVANGRIRPRGDLVLPEAATVHVVVPGVDAVAPARQPAHVVSPRLARPEQAAHFAKRVIEASPDARHP